MGPWETDDEYMSGPAAVSLPTPQDTPYRTPSRASRRSRHSTRSPGRSSSPPPLPIDRNDRGSKRSSRDVAVDDNISILDPRRFTPTLHANLVSEILALRRDQEEKTRLIESLEDTLHATKEEHESVKLNYLNTTKETRSLKRQLALLEGGTSSALGDLVRERDEAVDNSSETKKRLDAAQKKLRSQEDDSQRVHEQWAEERENWEEEKRKYERKLHVAESRLKVVLEEVAAFQSAQINHANQPAQNSHESDVEESGKENDAASVRTMSITGSLRYSTANGTGSYRPNGHSLADELNFDGDDTDQTDAEGRESALSHYGPYHHSRNFSRDSIISRMHRRNQSLESLRRPGSTARGKVTFDAPLPETAESLDEESQPPSPKASYTDTGIQYSPPPSPEPVVEQSTLPSPEPVAEKPAAPEPAVEQRPVPSPPAKVTELENTSRGDNEIEANQRRKRVQISRPLIIEPHAVTQQMISASSQTLAEPLSPPETPCSPTRAPPPPPIPAKRRSLVSSSTQTDDALPSPDPPSLLRPFFPEPPPIPSISIHPPTSRPTTPREPRLPQYFKHFGCQVNLTTEASTNDAGVQTDAIQTDKRMALLPPHLQPSSITSRPSSPNPSSALQLDKDFATVPGATPPPRNPRRLTGRTSTPEVPLSPVIAAVAGSDTHDAYPGNNDDGPLSDHKAAPIRRPHRLSSLFAGFEAVSSEDEDFGDMDFIDIEYGTALTAPRPPSTTGHHGKQGSTGTAPTSPEEPPARLVQMTARRPVTTEIHYSHGVADRDFAAKRSAKSARGFEKPLSPPPSVPSHASTMRKAAMIQNGITTHQGRPRSPSLPDVKNPPFPIPTRASSRKPPFTMSAPSDGQRSPTSADWQQRRQPGRSHYRSNSIRKVRSAAALPVNQRYRRHGSRSPPPLSPSTEAPESPMLPPLPRNDITNPRSRDRRSSQYKTHRHQLSANTDNTFNTYNTFNTLTTDPLSQPGGTQPAGVVDAIAQTMIGEWMFKYVRKRSSFGVQDGNGKDDMSHNDRHKRWVWLAPYERSILWSSKQPSSGSALMGKSGRKLTIQSVLDVKDDNAPPKGSTVVFNRSILILTPQRALKFTATSAERHYLWLTALSFLAHSSQSIPEIMTPTQLQAKPPGPADFDAPLVKARRPGIRDSIRLAKGRTGGPPAPPPPSIPTVSSVPSSQMGAVGGCRAPESVTTSVSGHGREDSRDAAEPPYVPRFQERANQVTVHGRKRSNTGGHVPPPLSFRGFSGPASNSSHHNSTNSTAGASVGTAGSSDIYQSQASSNVTWGLSQGGSQRTSEASSRPGNFFDAIGTVRMEAFISPLAFSQFNDFPDEQDEFRQIVRRRSKELRRRHSRTRNRHRDSSLGRGTRGGDDYYGGNKTAGEEDYFREDPFKGF
ncbi:hypothetical protein S7711_04609 [Stachybotrys chartarum IBT 7711]|uniref:Pleckstrin homology domain-containing protein n=1 Tax=Stachybotrys chartarum (strain CBS 109288 / IBT 7711) TaxID=1280523 RepID=A0A084AUG4_STACB|nr:hypothetical protein S7711_04609 [Stachybotrys chartarum IBT 7711]KFA52043.1 hypothetical protein S40293_02991 [Stachybotrys chartarum IBT 40293]